MFLVSLFFLCDQDDIWLPNKVEESLNALKSNKCSLVMSTINVIDSEGKVFQKNSKLKKTSFRVCIKEITVFRLYDGI